MKTNEKELKEIYSTYSNEKLLFILNNPEDYREIVVEVINEIIWERGGISKVKKNIELNKEILEEKQKVIHRIKDMGKLDYKFNNPFYPPPYPELQISAGLSVVFIPFVIVQYNLSDRVHIGQVYSANKNSVFIFPPLAYSIT